MLDRGGRLYFSYIFFLHKAGRAEVAFLHEALLLEGFTFCPPMALRVLVHGAHPQEMYVVLVDTWEPGKSQCLGSFRD